MAVQQRQRKHFATKLIIEGKILISLSPSQFQVLYPALRWLEHESIGRRRHCFEVLSHVRLPLIPPEVLDEAIKGVKDPSLAVALKTVRVDMVSWFYLHPRPL